jgi:hypothetical protein
LKNYHRKKYIVDRKFQFKLIAKFILLIILTTGIILLIIELFFNKPYKFRAQGQTIFLYRDEPVYKNGKIVSYNRYGKGDRVIYQIKLKRNNKGKIIYKNTLDAQGNIVKKNEIIYDTQNRKKHVLIIKNKTIQKRIKYKYLNARIKNELIYNQNGRLIKYGEYKYAKKQKKEEKSVILKVYYHVDIYGNKTESEIERWEYFYDHNNNKIEAKYERKDGNMYLYKIKKYKDKNFNKLSYITLYEDKFKDQFKDFLFQPIYNKDGDIVGLSRNPVNKYRLMILPIIFTASIILILTLIFSIIISHKMAGPLFRIKNYLKDMQKGIYGKKLSLRKDDDFKELANEIEKLSKILEKGHVIENSNNESNGKKRKTRKFPKIFKNKDEQK